MVEVPIVKEQVVCSQLPIAVLGDGANVFLLCLAPVRSALCTEGLSNGNGARDFLWIQDDLPHGLLKPWAILDRSTGVLISRGNCFEDGHTITESDTFKVDLLAPQQQ